MKKELIRILAEIRDLVFLAGFLAIPIAMFVMYLSILQPMSPLFTFLFVLFVTAMSLLRKYMPFVSLLGIALYVASWSITKHQGAIVGMMFCGLGIITWMSASGIAILYPSKTGPLKTL